jgi:hypothetical protein
MRSRSVLIAAVAAATTLALVVLKQPKTVALDSMGSSPRQEEGKIAKGRSYPQVPSHPNDIAALLNIVETALRNPATAAGLLPDLGHQQQVIYRVLSANQTLSSQVLAALPARWKRVVERHLAARREFLRMSRTRRPTVLPAWRIVAPEPAKNLLTYYQKAESTTGIEWEVLAAVNLVETGMGRIDGISVANAQGPMQFLPTTWAEAGIGQGNIRDPHDAIQAAARYLVRRGGLADISKGLWGYNNSSYYGRAVLLYASLMREDPLAYIGLYHWEIHFNAADGDLWLPVGYHQTKPITVENYLKNHATSRPPAN